MTSFICSFIYLSIIYKLHIIKGVSKTRGRGRGPGSAAVQSQNLCRYNTFKMKSYMTNY